MGQFVDNFLDMFPDTVTVRTMSAPDAYGHRTLVSSADFRARVIGRVQVVADPGGQEQISSVQAIFAGTYGLTVEQEYTLPVRFSPRTPTPLSVGHATDELGASHERVYFYFKQSGT
jgi:hypothetical protein